MTNIFENAKFGDKFFTRDKHLAVYLYKVRELHLLVVNNGYEFDVPYTILAKDNGIKFDAVSSNYDIMENVDCDKPKVNNKPTTFNKPNNDDGIIKELI